MASCRQGTMRMGIFVLICMHILLWAGCQSTPGLHKLTSNENLPRRAIDPTQINRSSWRKLLEENGAVNSNVINEETVNASVIIEPKIADEKNATRYIAGKADVQDVKKDSVTEDAKKEEGKPDPAPLIAQKEDGESEGGVALRDDVDKAEEPKNDVNQETSKEGDEVEQNDTRTSEKEKVEVLKIEPIVPVQLEERPTSSANESVTKDGVGSGRIAQETSVQSLKEAVSIPADEKHSEAVSTDQVPSEKATVVEIKDAPNVDAVQGLNADPKDKDASDKLPETVKEDNSPVALTDNDKHNSTHEQADVTPDKTETSGESAPQDNPEKENSSLRENPDSKVELAEVNPIQMVANTSSDVKEMDSGAADKVVLTTQPEGVDKEQIAHENAFASKEKADNPKNTDASNEETSNPGDGKVEDKKHEDKNESSVSLESKEDQKSEDGTETVSQEQSDEKIEEKQEVSDHDGDKQSKSNDAGSNEEKADENRESSDGNVGSKDDESEENDAKDISIVAKSDDETEAATKEVELQLEAFKRDTVIETTVEQTHERDPSEDEYDIIQELTDLPTKFQETAGKVADHLRPDVIKWTDTSKVYFNLANQQITESFSPLIGKQYAPFFASMISYGILLLPLIVVILLFDHIKALFSLQKVLLFINIYLAAYFATLWLASFIIGLEPMSFFYSNSLSTYLSLQLLQGLGYFVYLILQTANVFHSCTSDTLVGKVTSTLQWTVAMAIGLHYYVTVFHPAVASKPPHTSWKFYAIYTAAFFVLCLFARIRWVKKQYVTSGSNIANKKS